MKKQTQKKNKNKQNVNNELTKRTCNEPTNNTEKHTIQSANCIYTCIHTSAVGLLIFSIRLLNRKNQTNIQKKGSNNHWFDLILYHGWNKQQQKKHQKKVKSIIAESLTQNVNQGQNINVV